MLLLHFRGLVSPVDLPFLYIYCGPMRWADHSLNIFRNDYFASLPEAFTRVQDRMLINVLQGHIISHSVFYSFEIASASIYLLDKVNILHRGK